MAYISIISENDKVYKSVILELRTGKQFEFKSGDLVKDWFQAKKKYVDYADDELYLQHLSSVDNFMMKTDMYESAWLLYGSEGENPRLVYEFDEKGWEIIVTKGTKLTWEDLKQKCKLI
jgi:hypothetical protein